MNFNFRPPGIDVNSTFKANEQVFQTNYPTHPMANLDSSSVTDSSCSSSNSSSQQSIEHNDFCDELIDLGTLHKNLLHIKQMYTIFVYRKLLHHAIIISDGRNDPITFELTVMDGKAGAVLIGGRTIAKVVAFTGNKNDLERFGEVTCTLYELTQKAAKILNSDRNYNWISNNCQNFCTRFLEANGLRSYTTDTRIAVTAGVAAVAAIIAIVAICSIE